MPMTSAEYAMKKIGPSTDPWGTPEVTIVVPEVSPLKRTNWDRPVRFEHESWEGSRGRPYRRRRRDQGGRAAWQGLRQLTSRCQTSLWLLPSLWNDASGRLIETAGVNGDTPCIQRFARRRHARGASRGRWGSKLAGSCRGRVDPEMPFWGSEWWMQSFVRPENTHRSSTH